MGRGPCLKDFLPRAGAIVAATFVISNFDSEHPDRADYTCDDGADAALQIEQAIADLPAEGGRIVLLETPTHYQVRTQIDIVKDNVVIFGQGRGTKLFLIAASNCPVFVVGDAGTAITGVEIWNLQIDGNKANNATGNEGILFNGGAGFLVTECKAVGCWVHHCKTQGIYENLYTSHSEILNCEVDNNDSTNIYMRGDQGLVAFCNVHNSGAGQDGIFTGDGDGIRVIGNEVYSNAHKGIHTAAPHAVVSGNDCYLNTEQGIYVCAGEGSLIVGNNCHDNLFEGIFGSSANNCIVEGNVCWENTYDGIEWGGQNSVVEGNLCYKNGRCGITTSSVYRSLIENNMCRENGYHGIALDYASHCHVMGNVCLENSKATNVTYSGIYVGDSAYNDYITIEHNKVRKADAGNTHQYGIDINHAGAEKCIVRDNDLHDAGATANFHDIGLLTYVEGNIGTEITDEKVFRKVTNTSGVQLDAGDVVVLKAVAAGNEITTTVTEGDQKVYGMVAETIADAASGLVEVEGYTTALKVNGTAAIAIGDLIGCFTAAKIGMKAAAGKMAFAIALEAYAAADSLGVIDALIIKPRQAI